MKYVIAIPDGAVDILSAYPDGNTPLQQADTPTMDELADYGTVGWARTVPDGCHPGSDVACLSIFGYDPSEVYTGRAPLEAASLGLKLGDLVAFRCNLVTIENGVMKEFTAGHITTEEAAEIIKSLNEANYDSSIEFHTGVQYRHVMTAPPEMNDVDCAPPHDILDQSVQDHLPSGEAKDKVIAMMEWSKDVLKDHPVNQNRRAQGKSEATQIWLWGQGTAPVLTPYQERCGLTGGVITAVDLIRGIGLLAGLNIIHVDGATGLPDTNYEGKAQAALDVLKQNDFVVIHVESVDEMGHAGDERKKTKAIHDFDQRMLKHVLDGLRQSGEEFRMLVLPDHATPISLRTHTGGPVPFILYDSRSHEKRADTGYSEIAVEKRSKRTVEGCQLIDYLTEKKKL